MPPVPKAPVVAPLITWLDAHEFSPPREPAVGATAWYEQNDHRWAGALHYLKNETLHGPPKPRRELPVGVQRVPWPDA